MVSTRGPRSRYIEKGEKVLCYEPDPTKAKVLYDSKILGIYESKDKRGRKVLQYKVHFQGWSSSWDRKVNADFVLKDTVENRQLQRDLAEKAQLQLGAYLYRKERSGSSKKRSGKSATSLSMDDSGGGVGGDAGNSTPSVFATATEHTSPKSEDNFSSGSNTFEKQEDSSMKDDDCGDTDSSCSSSMESLPDEDRVLLRISERLRQYLEYDHDMVVKYGKQHALPSTTPVIAILENFVKQSAIKLVYSTTQTESTRRRSTQQRTDKKEREFDKLVATVGLLKEVADGIRIYFDFTIAEHLLYKEEKDNALFYLSEENLKNFIYVESPGLSTDFLNPKCDIEQVVAAVGSSSIHQISSTTESSGASGGVEMLQALHNNTATVTTTATELSTCSGGTGGVAGVSDEPQKRKLRSHRSDDGDLMLENCLSSIASTSSGASTPLYSNVGNGGASLNYLKSLQPTMALSIPPQTKEFLQALLSWHLLPANATPAPSMIFGAPHLARLMVKLPEFLNATSMNDEKLKILLQHLGTFVNFLEAHKEWFNEENYARTSSSPDKKINIKTENPNSSTSDEQQQRGNSEDNTITTTATTSTTSGSLATTT